MRLILVAPSLPENVGMAARAMRTFGFDDLVLVGGVDPRHPQAIAAAAGADSILEAARSVESLDQALEGIACAVGTTARIYDRPDLRILPVRQAAGLAVRNAPMAWVMGTERSGLTKQALIRCQILARIPSVGPSLNLAQAVAICLYETIEARQDPQTERGALASLATATMDRPLGEALADWLTSIGVARPQDARSKAHSLARTLARAGCDPHEAALLEAIARRLL